MENELDLNLEELDQIEGNSEKKLQVRNRYQQLANAKTEAQQKAEAEAKARTEAEAKAQEALKQVEFYKNFNTVASKHPEATNYQDQIFDRYSKGLDMEEATLGILAKEGKLTPMQPQPIQPDINPIGGSAINNMPDGPKDFGSMSQAEMLAELQEAEKTGDLQQTLRSGLRIG